MDFDYPGLSGLGVLGDLDWLGATLLTVAHVDQEQLGYCTGMARGQKLKCVDLTSTLVRTKTLNAVFKNFNL